MGIRASRGHVEAPLPKAAALLSGRSERLVSRGGDRPRTGGPATPVSETSLRPLIQQLVDQLSEHPKHIARGGETRPARGPHDGDHDDERFVLFDLEMDGSRYRLVRSDANIPALALLSPREQEICRMVAKGHPNKTIAAILDISTWTVGTYLRRLFAKLNVTSRAAMVAKLME
jgi:DNA-binding CsgD family transcriptional regulator